ncbi:hypothetical protein ACW6B4_001974 [Yersinia ruckeri]|uniref:hypothetical protein n=1 Tax=Yersinia ruckeri TaxID=29486 RepID=UPI0005369191|nr:hypothetical protein [Yersinia ruckeri]AUQ40625.1 hypothetical protein NJ56_00895 [Yersinia ruckeri]WMS05419.1 hypothetical protein RDY86_16240 [Yersinia ruckeri]
MVYLNTFLAFFALSGYSFFFLGKKYTSIFSLPVIVISLIISIVYVFGVLGYLVIGYYTSLVVGIILLFFSIIQRKTFDLQFDRKNWLVLIICITPFLVYFISVASDFMFTTWDEFSFWAISLKFIYPFNSLYTAESSVIRFKAYPPAQQLLQYFVVKTLGWKESYVIITQIFFILSCLLSTAGQLIKNKLAASIIFVTSITLLYFFNFNISTIYADPLLGAYFSSVLAWCITCNESRKDLIICALFLFTIVIIKQIGLILACIAIVTYFLVRLNFKDVKSLFKTNIVNTLFLFSSVISSYVIWSFYTKSIGAGINIIVPSLKQFLSPPLLEKVGVILINFGGQITSHDYFKLARHHDAGLSLVMISCIVILLFFSAYLLDKKEKSVPSLIIGASLIIGFVIYNAFLLFSYIVIFTDYEGRNLASFYRYSGTYLLAVLLVSICVVVNVVNQKGRFSSIIASVITFLLALSFVPPTFYNEIKLIQGSNHDVEIRAKVSLLADKIKKDAHGKDVAAYFISQHSTGFEKYVFNYEIMPLKSLWWCWSIGKLYSADDVWTCDKPLMDLTENYQYIAVYKGDQQFWNLARKYLADGSQENLFGVYRIERNNNQFTLVEVR